MSTSTGVTPRLEETDTEIELSAVELLALSDPRPAVDRAASSAKSASRRKLGLPLSLVAAVGIVGVIYVLTNRDSAAPSAANISQPTAPSEWPAPQQLADGEPVRFANPFDTDEVFEFPPGTSETQARDAVAEVLMKRAISRQKT